MEHHEGDLGSTCVKVYQLLPPYEHLEVLITPETVLNVNHNQFSIFKYNVVRMFIGFLFSCFCNSNFIQHRGNPHALCDFPLQLLTKSVYLVLFHIQRTLCEGIINGKVIKNLSFPTDWDNYKRPIVRNRFIILVRSCNRKWNHNF